MNRILVTGGLGYIGSHTCVALIEAGYHPVVIDSLRNTRISVKKAIEEITGKSLEFYQLDAKDTIAVSASIGNIDGVIHFAAVNYSEKMNKAVDVFNVGTGQGNSVLELTEIFEKVNYLKLKYSIGYRRPGDIEAIFTDTSKIESKLGWKSKKELPTSMKDNWKWEKNINH